MSEEKPSHEVEGIVRRAPRQDCVEAQIWGRVTTHFCSIEGPQEHSGLLEVTKNLMVTLTELERICRCANLVVSYPRRLEAVITAKGASTKY